MWLFIGNPQQPDVYQQMQRMTKAPYESYNNPMDQMSLQNKKVPDMIQKVHPSYQQSEFQKPIMAGYDGGNHIYEQNKFPAGFQNTIEENMYETVHPFSTEDLKPEVRNSKEHILPPKFPLLPETSEVPEAKGDIHAVTAKTSMNEPVLNVASSLSTSKEGGTQPLVQENVRKPPPFTGNAIEESGSKLPIGI